jgi:hypothetical protein
VVSAEAESGRHSRRHVHAGKPLERLSRHSFLSGRSGQANGTQRFAEGALSSPKNHMGMDMANLSMVDMKLIDSLFGMYGGYVLNFSNKTFASFFSRDIGIDIYDEAYAVHGDSKGKRLLGFLERGQAAVVAKALAALWEIREIERAERGDDEEKVPKARERLSALVERLGGAPLPGTGSADRSPASEQNTGPARADLDALDAEYRTLVAMHHAPQARGYAFERFLKRWFDVWGLDAHASFRLTGEQIDGSFQHGNDTYLVEAKWQNKPVDAQMLHGFQGKLLERPDWTRGLSVAVR